MPKIPTLKSPKKPKRTLTEKRKTRWKTYHSNQWQSLRTYYLVNHPLCECCATLNLISEANDVHHLKSPFDDGLTPLESQERLTDQNNLVSLCKECHGTIHGNPDFKSICRDDLINVVRYRIKKKTGFYPTESGSTGA